MIQYDKEKNREYQKKYREKNKEKIKEYAKKYNKTKKYKEYQKEYQKEYNKNNKEKLKEYKKENKEKIKEYQKTYQKEYYEENKEKVKKDQKKYHKTEKYKEYQKKYGKTEKKKKYLKKHKKEYYNNILKNDPLFKLEHNIRTRIQTGIKHNLKITKKSNHTKELLGCSWTECRTHLEKQFKDNMSWENYGRYWHIDHIIPVNFFHLEDSTEQYLAFHYGNLQPLTKEDNMGKHDTVPKENFRY